ncbi:hypothetical protein JL721_10151 [Aureococcus anophagefferens]|nr:hypothetical protein JL721_10151 [Aureococcus anophagefferens]
MADAPRPPRARTPLGDASNRGAGGLRDWGAAAAKKAPRAQSTHPIVSRLPPSPAERAAQEPSPARRRAPSMPPRAAPNVEVRKLTAYAAYTRMHMLKNKMRNEEAMEQLLRHMSAAEDVELPEVDRAAGAEAPASPRRRAAASPATPEAEAEDDEEAEAEDDEEAEAEADDDDDDDVVEAPEPASPPFSPEAASRDDLDMSDLELEQSPRRQPARAFGGAAPVARPVQTAVRLSAYEATLARPEIMDKFLRLQSDLFAKRAARPDLCAGGDVEDPRPSPGRRGRAGRTSRTATRSARAPRPRRRAAEPSAYGSFDSATQGGVILDGGGPLPRNSKALVVDAARISGRVLWFDARKNYGAIQPDRPLPGCDGGDGGAPYVFVHGNDVEAGGGPGAALRTNDAVEFCRGTCPRGRAKAAHVTVVATAPPYYGPPRAPPAPGDARARAHRRTPRSPPPRWPQPYYGSPYAPPAYGRYGSPRPPGAAAPPARLLGRVKWFDAQSGRPKALDVVRLVPAADGPEDGDGRGALGAFAAGDEPLFDGRRLAGVVVRFDAQHRWGFIRPDDPACQPEAGGENFFLHGLDVLDGGGPVVAGSR